MRLANLLRNGLLAGAVLFSVGLVFHLALPSLVPALTVAYKDSVFRPWHDWTMAYMVCHPLWYGFLFAGGFEVLQAIKKNDTCVGTTGGMVYGALVFTLGSLPIFVLEYASLQIKGIVVVAWILQNACQYVAAGAVLGCVTDGVVIRVSTELKLSAEEVWERLKRKSTFLYITGWMVGYPGAEDWPEELFTGPGSIPMRVRLFHLLPEVAHEVEVVRVDKAAMQIQTYEHGRLVRCWEHFMQVEPIRSDLCRYTDLVKIQAGWLTPAIWDFASLFYRFRHLRWRKPILQPNSPTPVEGEVR